MDLKALSTVDSSEWDNNVIKLGGNGFHSYRWIQFSSHVNNSSPIFFYLYDKSHEICAIAFGLLATKNIFGMPIFTTLSFGSFPSTKNPNITQIMIEKIITHFISHMKILILM